jgi:hypothetical protein
MSNYSKTTNFASKDSLATGNPLKIIKGTEIDDEFEAIETSIATKAETSSPTFTGTVTIPTASVSSGTIATLTSTTATMTTANITTVDLGDWTITEASGTLYFAHTGTNKMKLDSSGNLIVVGDITAFGTI